MISISGAVSVFFYLLIGCLIFGILAGLVEWANPPEPYKRILKIAIVILAAMVLIGFLLSLISEKPLFRP